MLVHTGWVGGSTVKRVRQRKRDRVLHWPSDPTAPDEAAATETQQPTVYSETYRLSSLALEGGRSVPEQHATLMCATVFTFGGHDTSRVVAQKVHAMAPEDMVSLVRASEVQVIVYLVSADSFVFELRGGQL